MAFKGIDCLIVDDEEDICDILEYYVEGTGLFRNVQRAYNGKDAIMMLSMQTYGLVLLDCNLPYFTGKDVVNNIGATSIENVVIVSGDIDEKRAREFLKHGIKHFLIKPFSLEGVQSKLSAVLKTEVEIN